MACNVFIGGSKEYEKAVLKWNKSKPIERLKIMRESGIQVGDPRSVKKRHEHIMNYLMKKI